MTAIDLATTSTIHTDPARRHDFVLLFDVTDGNPNGDPDAGNLPRVDPETMQGLVTDVAIKRKVRDYVDAARGDEGRYKIYIQGDEALNTKHQRAYDDLGITSTGSKQKREDVDRARDWMCANFYDIRMFGAVMATGVNAGQVRGPAQLTFARSIDPIVYLDLSITRIAITDRADMDIVVTDEGKGTGGKRTEMGRKSVVPYGLYRAAGFFNPGLAAQTGADEADLGLLWSALVNMWDLDRSASRGFMACRGIWIFSHDSPLGNAPAHRLMERVRIGRKADVKAARSVGDYDIVVDDGSLPSGVTLTSL